MTFKVGVFFGSTGMLSNSTGLKCLEIFFPLPPKLSYLKCKTEARWVFLILHFVISFCLIANINVVINLMLQIKNLKIFSSPCFTKPVFPL